MTFDLQRPRVCFQIFHWFLKRNGINYVTSDFPSLMEELKLEFLWKKTCSELSFHESHISDSWFKIYNGTCITYGFCVDISH
jgi:hypothetical protein